MKQIFAVLLGLSLVGAAQPEEREIKPGEGVLCFGTFIYVADMQAKTCYAGEDDEYQAWLDQTAKKFDAYMIRNFPNGEADLSRFKESQGIQTPGDKRLCDMADDDDSNVYIHWRAADLDKLDEGVTTMLASDGIPRWGDCV